MLSVELHLVVHFPLQLDDLVLHPRVEVLQVLGRSSFDLPHFELFDGESASERTLDDDGGVSCTFELLPLQPAADALLDDHGLVMHEELRRRRDVRGQREEIRTTESSSHLTICHQHRPQQHQTGSYLPVNPACEHPLGVGLDGDDRRPHPQKRPAISHHAKLLLTDERGSAQTQVLGVPEEKQPQEDETSKLITEILQ